MNRQILWQITIGLWIAFGNLCVVNAQGADGDKLAAQRREFVELEKGFLSLPDRKLTGYDQRLSQLQDYPLYPYALRSKLQRNLSYHNRTSIEQFLHTYDGLPVTQPIRRKWLKYLAKYNKKSAFLASYREGLGSEISCHYLGYQLQSSRNIANWSNDIRKLWLNAKSQPKSCDPVFKAWRKSGHMTAEDVLGRVALVAKAGNSRLLPYLKRRLPQQQAYLVDLWHRTKKSAAYVGNKRAFPLKYPRQEAEILAYGLQKLAWSKPGKAATHYQYWQQKGVFTAVQNRDLLRAIALSFTLDKSERASEWLSRADIAGAQEDVKRWRLAHMVEQGRWQESLALIQSAPSQISQQSMYRYWLARSYGELGMLVPYGAILNELADERSYYGFLASARIEKPANLNAQPLQPNAEARDLITALPAARRAYEFVQLERWVDGRREWYRVLQSLNHDQLTEAALVASDWGWYDQAITAFSKSGYLNDVERRFPLAFQPEINRYASEHDVEPAFALAIARRESSFMVDAVSSAGARGLMQLLPSTASYLQQSKVNRGHLFNPAQNLEFGVKYLRFLKNKMGNNPVLVSAAYNAGWSKVMQWLPESQGQPTDVWIENIPYRETRAYVKAVMAYRHIYEHRLDDGANLFQHLADAPIPTHQSVTQYTAQQAALAPK